MDKGTITSKKQALKYYSSIFWQLPLNEVIVHNELMELLKHHYHYQEKTGGLKVTGIVKRKIRKLSYVQYTLFLVLENGKEVDISFVKAIDGLFGKTDTPHRDKVIKACREAIQSQIREFRKSQLIGNDKILHKDGYPVNLSECHIDHVYSFTLLLEDFLRSKGYNYEDIEVKELKAGGYKLVNKTFKKEWQEYHKQHAKLQVLTKKENLSKPGKYA